ncbi:MAG: hypothetical protein L3J10_03890 [Sulfurimonas sp.]|nr:hypothetical protein [Sulfurimonas sp.]
MKKFNLREELKTLYEKEEDKRLAHLVLFFASDSKEILIARKLLQKVIIFH